MRTPATADRRYRSLQQWFRWLTEATSGDHELAVDTRASTRFGSHQRAYPNMLRTAKVEIVTGLLQDTAWAIKRIQSRHLHLLGAALEPLGVTLVQWDALRQMHWHPHASLHDLAQLTYQSDQAFGTLATRMAARGLIERVTAPGRAVRHRVTEKGEGLRARGAAVVDATLADSLGGLDEADLTTLHRLLFTLLESQGDEVAAAPPSPARPRAGR